MRYGFIIDNRKCIGCHACTTACKAEHAVPVGVNRTWVKQVEKGEFPDTRRLFSVMRCNHCTDAPCVDICPTEALFTREDGIVDFDRDRCIGCKSCMQACPYDALYIDPETHTAAKCNYCAHRIDIGLEPACVNVCPEHAIISGDMDDPNTEIAELLARQAVKVRKPEKGTVPNLFYIDGDDASLVPGTAEKTTDSMWGSQARGVGHYAKEAEKMAYSNGDVVAEIINRDKTIINPDGQAVKAPKSIDVLMTKSSKSVYDTPDKGILWGWEVSGYIWTKAVAAGAILAPALISLFGMADITTGIIWSAVLAGLIFLALTGVLLIRDLDQPSRFFYVLLRPHFGSWLVKGGYTITIYGGLLTLLGLSLWMSWNPVVNVLLWISAPVAVLLAIYTAFLLAQAKGRDFWQSPGLSIHMLVHAVMAGLAAFQIMALFTNPDIEWLLALNRLMVFSLGFSLLTLFFEFVTTHSTLDAERAAHSIIKGRYSRWFWIGVILAGHLIPMALLTTFAVDTTIIPALTAVLVLIGLAITEHIWVEAPQRISLT